MIKNRQNDPGKSNPEPEPKNTVLIQQHEEIVPYPVSSSETSSNSLPPLEEMKKEILRVLRQDRHSLAAAMEKSGHWNLEDYSLSLSFDSPFESTFIEKESREIETLIQENLGWKVKIKTVINQSENITGDEETEEQVELVRNVFRGTIINRS